MFFDTFEPSFVTDHTSIMDSLRKREEELMRRNAALEERNQEVQANAEMALKGTPKTSKLFRALGAEDGGENMIARSNETAGRQPSARTTKEQNNLTTPPSSPFRRKPQGLSPNVRNASARSAEKHKSRYKTTQKKQSSQDAASPGSGEVDTEEPYAVSYDAYQQQQQAPGTPTEGLASEATFRYQRARIVVLEEELSRAKEEIKGMGKEKLVATGKANELSEEKNKLERKFQNSRSMLEKSKKENKTLTTRAESAEKEVASLRRELQDSLKQVKKASASSGSRDVRLNRAAEENDRLKEKVKDLEGQLQDATHSQKGQHEQLASECRRLERQRNELLSAFKKQMKLIDVLKRQKMHIEAAKLLNFTEEEFSKTLDITTGGAN